MKLNLKNKIALGGVFLFALLILVGVVSFYYFNRLIYDSGEIVKDNYETLNYCRDILAAVDQIDTDSLTAFGRFEKNITLQEKNITEPGEKEMTASLRREFNLVRAHPRDQLLRSKIRDDLSQIMSVNLNAIDRKNQATKLSAENAKTIISIILTVCFLLGMVFIFNFPALVANPLVKLTQGIQAIANKNYSQRIHLERTDEFGDLAQAFNNMAERLDEYEHSNLASILFEKQRAETVINSLKDASIGIGLKDDILFANRQALQLLNLKETDLVGKKIQDVSRQNDLFRFLLQDTNGAPFKIVVDGKENYFTREILDISLDNQTGGRVLQLKNITPFKELDVAKTNFMATISHELKTPLASSDFSLKLLEDERVGKLTSEQMELVHSLKSDNQRLLRILSELLDLSQVETGKIQLNIHHISPLEIFGKALDTVSNALLEKNITTRRIYAGDLPKISADPDKTVWVLNNFLSNAIRYSPTNGEILVEMNMAENNFVEFAVRDYGQGIDISLHQKIFDRYFKVPGTIDKRSTGLGLAISKEFVEAMGGHIGVESEPGRGSRFFCRLPAHFVDHKN